MTPVGNLLSAKLRPTILSENKGGAHQTPGRAPLWLGLSLVPAESALLPRAPLRVVPKNSSL